MKSNTSSGFTLIELLVVIGIITILSTLTLIAVYPSRQFSLARDTTRKNDIYQVLNAVYQYSIDNNGNYPPSLVIAGSTPADFGTGELNLEAELVPDYIPAIPKDPSSGTDTLTKYVLFLNGSRITASATGELTETITLSR